MRKRTFWVAFSIMLIIFGILTTLSASIQKALFWSFVGATAVVIGVLLFAYMFGEAHESTT